MEPKQNILVTGATGFIGQHLVHALVKENYHVYALYHTRATKTTAPDPASNEAHPIYGDISDIIGLFNSLSTLKIGAIAHLAACVPPKGARHEKMLACFETNVRGTFNLLHVGWQLGIPHFVYTSTQGVYGTPRHLPVSERAKTQPIDFYGFTKLQGEELCRYYARHHQLKVIVLRYGGVYGPGKNDGAVYNFFQSAYRGEPPPISGGGSQSRDFVNVGDIVAGTVSALKRVRKASFEVYNLGCGRETTVSEMAKAVYNISGAPVLIEKTAPPSQDRFYLDIDRASKRLGYSPRPLEQAVREMFDRIKDEMARTHDNH